MAIFIPLLEFINYLLFSILSGYIALQFVPSHLKPSTQISKKMILLTILGIYICSFGPVAQVISYFSDSVGFLLATYSVLTDFQVGTSWIITGFLSVFLWITIVLNGSKWIQAILLLFMVFAIGYSSHVASLSFWPGLFAHSTHFLLIIIWAGILFHIAWFSTEFEAWDKFLKWFTPFALVCLGLIFISGFFLMFYVVEPKEYIQSWVLPYGQMLLLKHISIVPLLIFAFINGVLLKMVNKKGYDPVSWLKSEAIFVLVTFSFTSIMGTLSPPHDVDFTVSSEGASKWVEWFLGKDILSSLNIGLSGTLSSILLFVLAILFIGMILVSVSRENSRTAVFFGISFIFAMYFGWMLSLTI